ncbi:sterol desaturase family protein [Shewanella sedimentimangrovi]|uniref:Sterol desaturase family protein n=1 Tax=Shewanella sedimentimangrovi TaxID=2814293 RepID=A0ABX7QZE6_9GAMM|nr:sterol desaturase family protein [Shewanella sedimentimangrovi]QSX36296.1 sterol desaturase family protein [Shewanella sedimentimangrovi]
MGLETLVSHPEFLLLALAPVFFLFIALEWYLGDVRGRLPASARYRLPEVLCNLSLAGMHQGADLLAGLAIAKLYLWLFGWRLFDIDMNWQSFLLLLLAQDFCYYWFHRASHRVRWMWAAHVAHHSSENMNFSTAFRQSMLYPLAGMWMFWIPLVIIGFDPAWVVFSVLASLGFQFFVHTQLVGKLGWLESLFNTPSHHRVHHGSNPQYIDKNYAGVLIIWDRLFCTFEPEIETVRYGITKPVNSFNPLKVTFGEARDMLREACAPDLSLKQRGRLLFAPPAAAVVENSATGAENSGSTEVTAAPDRG